MTEKEYKREQIFLIFAEEGVENVRNKDIVKTIGCSSSTVTTARYAWNRMSRKEQEEAAAAAAVKLNRDPVVMHQAVKPEPPKPQKKQPAFRTPYTRAKQQFVPSRY